MSSRIITLTKTATYTFAEEDRDELMARIEEDCKKSTELHSGRKVDIEVKTTSEKSSFILDLEFLPDSKTPEVIYIPNREEATGFKFNERMYEINQERLREAILKGRIDFGI
jgi:hypothetical protein